MIRRESAERAFALGLLSSEEYLKATLDIESARETIRAGAPRARLELIRELLERTDLPALSIVRELTRDACEPVRVHAAQALSIMEGRLRERIRRSEEHLLRGPGSGWRWSEVGEAHLAMARVKESVPVLCDHYLQQAVTAFRRALQYETRIDWMLSLAEAEELGRQWTQAEAMARRALDRDPFAARALLLLARVAYRRGRFGDSRAYMRRLALAPDLSPAVEDLVGCWVPESG